MLVPHVSWEGSVNLSVATKLKEVIFRSVPCHVKWVAVGLRTITSAHKDLREVSIIIPFLATPIDRYFGEGTYRQWTDLDRVLIQLWQSYSVRTKLVYAARGGPEAGERVCEFIRNLLPETMKGGAIDLVGSAVDLC